jgi:hypothetical protein
MDNQKILLRQKTDALVETTSQAEVRFRNMEDCISSLRSDKLNLEDQMNNQTTEHVRNFFLDLTNSR